jgi:hypothetical protein
MGSGEMSSLENHEIFTDHYYYATTILTLSTPMSGDAR